MFKLIKFFVTLALLGVFIWFGATVPLGNHTLFGHFSAIWHTKETQDLVNGTKEKAGPAIDRLQRGVKAGVKAAEGDEDAAPKKKHHKPAE